MSAGPESNLRKLFDLPLGSRFRYVGHEARRVYVLLDYADGGLIADAPNPETSRVFQGLYSAAESRQEFCEMLVELVQVQEIDVEKVAKA